MRTYKDLMTWYFSRKALPYWSILLLDCCFVLFAGFLSYAINHGATATANVFTSLMWTLGIFLVCFIIGFRVFHTYDGVIRFSSFTDLVRVTLAVMISTIIVFLIQKIIDETSLLHFSVSDIILFSLFSAVFMWIMRVWVKTMYENSVRSESKKENAFILGVKTGGVALAKNMNSANDSPFRVAGFVAAEPDMQNRRLMGVKVHPFNKALAETMLQENVSHLIVSPLLMDLIRDEAALVDNLIENGIKIMIVPKAREWDGKSDLKASELRPVNVEDLLPREKIEVDMHAAAELITGHTVLITGAAGSIGSEMVRQVSAYSPSLLILIDQAETPMHDIRLMMHEQYPNVNAETIVSDIANKKIMERFFAQYKPEYVFHAAAYKHVPMMEDNPYESVINNVNGTKIIADLAVKYGAKKFVMVSTDKAVNPTNIMGCSKRICEIYVQALDTAIKENKIDGETRFVTTRFGNVLGSNGSVIPIFQEQIRKGGPVTVTHPNIIRYFMLIPEACKLVIEAGTMGRGGEIFVFDMGEPVKIADLAKRMITLSGAKDIEIRYTGLRDGEKLYEEVLNDKEITLPTFHDKIKIAKVREYDYTEINKSVIELIQLATQSDDMTIVRKMKSIVPEFKSQHSVYEVLDRV